MKALFKSFTSFTRTERMGLIGLSGLLIVLVIVRMTMHFGVKPHQDEQKEKEMVAAWEKFKKEHAVAADTTTSSKQDTADDK